MFCQLGVSCYTIEYIEPFPPENVVSRPTQRPLLLTFISETELVLCHDDLFHASSTLAFLLDDVPANGSSSFRFPFD
jgi:hypothetical protein